MTRDPEMYPETALEALKDFEKGRVVTVIELGGLGPGYEQAIWNGIFKMIKDRKNANGVKHWVDPKTKKYTKLPNKQYLTYADQDCLRVCKGMGLSGAQAGAIMSTTYQVLTHGWREMIMKAPDDRLIVVSKDYPKY